MSGLPSRDSVFRTGAEVPVAFAGATAVLLLLETAVAGAIPGADAPGVLALAVTLDLTLFLPLAYWLVLVRGRGWPLVSVAPVFFAGLLAARLLLPAGHEQPLRYAELLALPVELAVLGIVGARVARAVRHMGTATAGRLELLRAEAAGLVGRGRLAGILATELAVLYYGLAAWRAAPEVPPGAAAFTLHRRSGSGGIAFALVLALLVETVAVHLLVARWSGLAAWLLTAGSLYAALWVLADYRALVLRPLLLDGDRLHVRIGLRWSAELPAACIEDTQRRPPPGPAGLHLPTGGVAMETLRLSLAEEVIVIGPYGVRRRARSIGLAVDEPARLAEALAAGRAG